MFKFFVHVTNNFLSNTNVATFEIVIFTEIFGLINKKIIACVQIGHGQGRFDLCQGIHFCNQDDLYNHSVVESLK